jgi:hypothetical protein
VKIQLIDRSGYANMSAVSLSGDCRRNINPMHQSAPEEVSQLVCVIGEDKLGHVDL